MVAGRRRTKHFAPFRTPCQLRCSTYQGGRKGVRVRWVEWENMRTHRVKNLKHRLNNQPAQAISLAAGQHRTYLRTEPLPAASTGPSPGAWGIYFCPRVTLTGRMFCHPMPFEGTARPEPVCAGAYVCIEAFAAYHLLMSWRWVSAKWGKISECWPNSRNGASAASGAVAQRKSEHFAGLFSFFFRSKKNTSFSYFWRLQKTLKRQLTMFD